MHGQMGSGNKCTHSNINPPSDSVCVQPSGLTASRPTDVAGGGSFFLEAVMGKDPAFLFYSADFLTGTHFFSNSETGAYIRILCHMADKGPLKEAQIKSLCGETGLTENLKSKLKKDKNGWYYQERLFEELEKRRKFCESRRASRTSNVRRTYGK